MIKLFCLPYAGGSAVMYYKFSKLFSSNIKIIPVELAGKGMRFEEASYETFESMTEEISEIIAKQVGMEDFAILGYSMGALCTYEISQRLSSKYGLVPKKIILSACPPPHIYKIKQTLHLLPEQEFLSEITPYVDLSEEVKTNEKAMRYFIRNMRSDLRLLSLYTIGNNFSLLSSEAFILFSDRENDNNTIFEWDKYFENQGKYIHFDSGHFFINYETDIFVKIINEVLAN